MQFRFYVTDLHEGLVFGTNSEEDAENLSKSEDYFVVDSENGTWLTSNGATVDIDQSGN